jgi:LmbE family N-acetylglucosaminyl deacetylase
MAKRLRRSGPSLALITDCNCSTDIRETLEVKRQAMSQHRTQTTRYDGSAGWEAIGDIHGGRMMRLFFQPFEAFRRYRTRGQARP